LINTPYNRILQKYQVPKWVSKFQKPLKSVSK
jgi:hypothetical protein